MVSPLDKTSRRAFATVLLALASCVGDPVFQSEAEDPPNSADTGPRPPSLPATQLTSLTEDFNNLDLIERTAGVIVDVNEGVVFLPTVQFPQAAGSPLARYDADAALNGVVAADQILIMPEGVIRASDSVELIAADLVRVTGQIYAGQGGVTIAAGHSVIIDGNIQSEGPVRILLSDPMGTIQVSGTIHAYSDLVRDVPSSLLLLSRGAIEVTGTLLTEATQGLLAGEILLDAYGAIRIGPGLVSSAAPQGGASGAIRIRSETRFDLFTGGWIGENPDIADPLTSLLTAAGDIEIQAPAIDLFERTRIAGASALEAHGASITITAGQTLHARMSSEIRAGTGNVGGSLAIHTADANFGEHALLSAGTGFASAGQLRVEASSSLELAVETQLFGGDGVCADGGPTTVFVAGDLTISAGSVIAGGAGGDERNPNATCPLQGYRGGDVQVIAHRVNGDDSGIRAGGGLFHADTTVVINPNQEVSAPNLVVAASGWVESKVIDRGADAVGQMPQLKRLWRKDMPQGTGTKLELAGSASLKDPIEPWIVVDPANPSALEVLSDARYFRYKLTLNGRVFDTPVIDLFEIELDPRHAR